MGQIAYSVINKEFDISTFPKTSTIPFVFDEPLPIQIECELNYHSDIFGTDIKVTCSTVGQITGWGNNSYFPSLYCQTALNGGQGGFCLDFGCANFTGSSTVTTYTNGIQTNQYTSTRNVLETANSTYMSNASVKVIHCNIPFMPDTNADGVLSYGWSNNIIVELIEWRQTNPSYQILKDYVLNATETETSPDGQEFRLEVQWTTGTWTNDTQPSVVGQPYLQAVKGKITDGKFALYTIEGIDDGKLKYGIKNTATFYDLEYSTDGVNWTPTDTFPFEFIYRKRYNELGTFSYALSEWNTDIPIWENEDDADDYMDGTKDISESSNWGNISSQYPPSNYTGIDDSATQMGEVYTRSFFSQQYICNASALQEISNAFFDTDSGGITGIVDDIIKGLRMYGNDVSQAIQGLMFFPIDLTQVFTSVQSQNYIYFGGYQFQMQNSVSKIIYPNGYVDFGSFVLKPSFNSYRDHSPYTRLYCYLAYIGWIELDVDRYLGKEVSIKYYIDTRTGGVLATIFSSGILTDYATGQMGVQMPITVTSYTEYANAQLQTLLTFGNGQGQNVSNIASMGGQLANVGVSGGAIATASVGLGAVGLGIGATKTLYGLTQNNINNFNKTKGGSTGMLNMFLPQECLFLFEIQDSDETSNEKSLQGYPSNASGQLQSFSGYLEVDAVNLVCGGATDNEKAEIIAQLKSGVII